MLKKNFYTHTFSYLAKASSIHEEKKERRIEEEKGRREVDRIRAYPEC